MLRPMFGMGGTEILVILVIAMIFLGPEKLPEAAAKISKGIREIRKQTKDLQSTIETDTEIGGAIRDLKSALRGDEIRRPPVLKKPVIEATEAKPLDAVATAASLPATSDSPEQAAEPRVEGPSAASPEAAPVTETAAAPATETAKAELDPDDPLHLIRPATGTAKREHG
jgi:sec-independent protein translocase protein TatB